MGGSWEVSFDNLSFQSKHSLSAQPKYGTIITTGAEGTKRISAEWSSNGLFHIILCQESQIWNVKYTLPECVGAVTCAHSIKWLHLCVVWDKNKLRMYVNGTLAATSSSQSTGAIKDGPSTLLMPNLISVRDLRIWDMSLTSSEVSAVYNESKLQFLRLGI